MRGRLCILDYKIYSVLILDVLRVCSGNPTTSDSKAEV